MIAAMDAAASRQIGAERADEWISKGLSAGRWRAGRSHLGSAEVIMGAAA